MSKPLLAPDAGASTLALRSRAAAVSLGVSERTLWGWTKDGLIPHVRVGTGKRTIILYPVDQLRAWLAQRAAAVKGGDQ